MKPVLTHIIFHLNIMILKAYPLHLVAVPLPLGDYHLPTIIP